MIEQHRRRFLALLNSKYVPGNIVREKELSDCLGCLRDICSFDTTATSSRHHHPYRDGGGIFARPKI